MSYAFAPSRDSAKPDFLAFCNTLIGMLQPFRCPAAHDGARDVAEIAGLLRTRKNIHDDGSVRANRTAALIVRIDALSRRKRRSNGSAQIPAP